MTITRAAAGASLIAEAVHTYGSAQFRVLGNSMRPLLRNGDVVHVQREAMQELERGQVAVFTRSGGVFAHRVIRTKQMDGRPALITKGDAFPDTDAPVREGELLGRVVQVVRHGKRITLDSPTQRALGKLVAFVSAAAPVWFPGARAVKRVFRAGKR